MSEPPPPPPSPPALPPPPVPLNAAPVGWAPVSGSKVCPACHLTLDTSTAVCPRCGLVQPPLGPGKNRLVAAALALILGGFGLHKFYLGRMWTGFLYLVLSWTGIPSLIAWIEGIGYLIKNDDRWALEHGGPVRRANRLGLGLLWLLALAPVLVFAWFVGH